jgi:acyl-CoA dehydrogenase
MSWNFSTEPEYQEKLDWVREFVMEEVEPLDALFGNGPVYDKTHPVHEKIVRPLQEQVKAHDLWACHLGPHLGGKGYGQVKLGLLNEILGRSSWAPSVFGTQAPDSGNAEILAHYGTDQQKTDFLDPLLDGRICSTYAMTEPQAGSDPGQFECTALRDGEEWVLNGEKWFASNYRYATFVIAMAVTDPDVAIHKGASMFLIPKGTPGMDLVRNVGLIGDEEDDGTHGYIRFTDCRVPTDNLLGGEGQAFTIAQTRLSGGRLHHAMRSVAVCQRAIDMMCERALSRRTQGESLSRKQVVQEQIADAWGILHRFRLQVLHAAWVADEKGTDGARMEIAAVKAATPGTLHDVVYRCLHLHGSLGMSNEMPIGNMFLASPALGIADGPTEVHQVTVARQLLKRYSAVEGLWPSEHLPARRAAAREKFAGLLEVEVANQ